MKAGWETHALGDLYSIGSSKRVLQSQWTSNGVPFYRGREITLLATHGFVNNALFIPEDLYTALATKNGVPVAGDIMITAIGTIGNSYIVRKIDRFYFKDASVLWLKKTNELSSEFINYWLRSPLFFDQLDRGNGATVDTLTIQKLQKVVVNLPPLLEQQCIVTLLDEAFDGIATARAHAEKNLQNARAIFESHLQSVFSERGEGWTENRLADVAAIINGFAFKSGDFSPNAKVRSIKITNVGVREFVCESDSLLPTYFAETYASFSIRAGSIVIALTRTIIAGGLKVAIVPDDFDGALLNQRVAAILVNPNRLNAEFLFSYLSSQYVFDYVKAHVNTLMQPNLSINDLRAMPLPLPPAIQQEQIAARLVVLKVETQHLESLYQQKITALDALKKSLLHRAFNGDL